MDKIKKHNNNIIFSLSIIYIFLIVLGGLNNSNGMHSKIGLLSIGVLIGTGGFIFILKLIRDQYILKKEKWMYIFSMLFILVYLLSILLDIKGDSIYTAVQVSMVILFFWGVILFPFKDLNYKISYYIIILFLLFHFLWWGSTGFVVPFSGIMNNPNPFGAFIAYFLGLFLIVNYNYKKANKIIALLVFISGLFLLYASGSRAAMLIIVTTFISYIMWPYIAKSKVLFNLHFCGISIFVLATTVLYPKLLYSPLAFTLQEISRSYTGKNFFSGRQIIWNDLLNLISQRPLLGYGASARPSEYMDASLSAHNFYLQMTLQVGVIGTILFSLLLFSIWNYLYKAKTNKTVRLSGSIFTGILVYQVFEVSFTQNILAVSIIQWLIIGIGVHFTRIDQLKIVKNLSNKKRV